MSSIKKHLFLVCMALLCCLLLPFAGIAQGEPGCDPLDPTCPIDGGLSLLIAAGIGIGAKKAYDAKKKVNQTNI